MHAVVQATTSSWRTAKRTSANVVAGPMSLLRYFNPACDGRRPEVRRPRDRPNVSAAVPAVMRYCNARSGRPCSAPEAADMVPVAMHDVHSGLRLCNSVADVRKPA